MQDLLARNSHEIYDLIFNKKGHIYICGDVKMAADVTNQLENVLHKKGNITHEAAKEYISNMKV